MGNKCEHEWHTAIEPDGWPVLQSGWYVCCVKCETWAVQQVEWVDDFEEPIGEPVIMLDSVVKRLWTEHGFNWFGGEKE